jgi:hypothetical protein
MGGILMFCVVCCLSGLVSGLLPVRGSSVKAGILAWPVYWRDCEGWTKRLHYVEKEEKGTVGSELNILA